MKKTSRIYIPILVLLGIVAGVCSPLLGINSAYAKDMGNIFPNAAGDDPDGGYQVNKANLDINPLSGYTNTKASAAFTVHWHLSSDSDSVPAVDKIVSNGAGNHKVDSEDDLGWSDALFTSTDLDKSGTNGIFLVVGTEKTEATGGDGIKYDFVNKSVPFTVYSKKGAGVPTTAYSQNPNIKNISWLLLNEDPDNLFFGHLESEFSFVVTGLQIPGQKYYAQIMLKEDGSSNFGFTKALEFTTAATDVSSTVAVANQTALNTATTVADPDAQSAFFGSIIECGVTSGKKIGGCFVYLYYLVYRISAFLLGLAGGVFDTFAAFSLGSNIYKDPSFIYEGWRITRDLSNMFFIFILLYLAIGIILNLHIDAKKALAKLIIIALVINFSLFFTRVIIDVSNSLAWVFYNEITISGYAQKPLIDPAKAGIPADPVTKQPTIRGISQGIVAGLDIQSIFSKDTFEKLQSEIDNGTLLMIITLGLIVNVVAMIVFLQCTIYFIGRILGLWFSMIFAPFAFVTSIVPSLSRKFKQLGWDEWIGTLMNLAIMAPMFMFFMYLIIAFLQSKFIDGLIANKTGLDFWGYATAMILQFMLIIGLLNESKNLAKEMSGKFGAAVGGAAKAVGMVAGAGAGLAMGGAAILGRKTLGAAASRMASSEELKNRAAGSGFSGWKARAQLFGAQNMAKSSFDVRQTGLANATSKATGMNFNALTSVPGLKGLSTQATAGGYEGDKVKKAEKMRKQAERLGFDHHAYEAANDSLGARKDNLEMAQDQKFLASEDLKSKKAPGSGASTKEIADAQQKVNDLNTYIRVTKYGGTLDAGSAEMTRLAKDPSNDKFTKNSAGVVQGLNYKGVDGKDMTLKQNEKGVENIKTARQKEFYWNKMKDSATQGIKTNEERDGFNNIKRYGTFDKNVPGARQWGMDIMQGLKQGLRTGAVTGLTAGAIAGPMGALVGAVTGAVGGGVLSVMKGRFNKIPTDAFGRQSGFEAARIAGDYSHDKLHGYESNYKSPSSDFSKIFEGSSSSHSSPAAHTDHAPSGGGGGHH